MSEDGTDVANGTQQQEESQDIPKYNLFIRASLIDNVTQGACPMSQQGFMLSYLLAQEKLVDFKVYTVSQVNPPIEFKEINGAKIYPFIEGTSGKNINGVSIEGYKPESADQVENFFDSMNNGLNTHLIRPKNTKNHILGKVDSISTQFNVFMKGLRPETVVTNILQRIEDHLETTGTQFLEGDRLSYTDCFLLPRLQHIVVAGKYFKDYEIPSTMKNVWRYLMNAYNNPAFCDTLPTDDDLLKFHWERLGDKEMSEFRKKGIKGRFGVDTQLSKTCSVPPEIEAMLGKKSNGNDSSEEEEPQQQQQQQEDDGHCSDQE